MSKLIFLVLPLLLWRANSTYAQSQSNLDPCAKTVNVLFNGRLIPANKLKPFLANAPAVIIPSSMSSGKLVKQTLFLSWFTKHYDGNQELLLALNTSGGSNLHLSDGALLAIRPPDSVSSGLVHPVPSFIQKVTGKNIPVTTWRSSIVDLFYTVLFYHHSRNPWDNPELVNDFLDSLNKQRVDDIEKMIDHVATSGRKLIIFVPESLVRKVQCKDCLILEPKKNSAYLSKVIKQDSSLALLVSSFVNELQHMERILQVIDVAHSHLELLHFYERGFLTTDALLDLFRSQMNLTHYNTISDSSFQELLVMKGLDKDSLARFMDIKNGAIAILDREVDSLSTLVNSLDSDSTMLVNNLVKNDSMENQIINYLREAIKAKVGAKASLQDEILRKKQERDDFYKYYGRGVLRNISPPLSLMPLSLRLLPGRGILK